jgi:hypothetical protein
MGNGGVALPGGVAGGTVPDGGAGDGLAECEVRVGRGVGDFFGVLVGDGDGVDRAPLMSVMMCAVHRTVDPPPFADPLHWLTLTRIAVVTVDVVTVHLTRR